MKSITVCFIFFVSLALLCTACSNVSDAQTETVLFDLSTSTPSTPHQDVDTAQIANPASVYCEEQGNRLEIRTAEDGSQYGICVFPDGSECDEWAFFRQECGPQDQGISTLELEPSPTLPPSTISPATARSMEHLNTLTGHTGRVTDLAFSPDGAYIASASMDHTIRVWDASLGVEVRSLPIRKPDLNVIAFSPDGRLLASGETIWDVETGQESQDLEQTINEVTRVTFSPDGSLLALETAGQPIRLWDIATGEYIREFDMPENALGYFGFVFSPDGKQLAGGGVNNGTVTVWDVASGQITGSFEHGDTSDVHDLAYSPDGSMLAGGGTGYAIRVWDTASGEVIHRLPLNNGIYGLAFSPDGSILATASCNRVVHLWDMETGIKLASLPHADELMAVAFSPDGTLLVAGGYDFTISVWGIP